MDSLYSSLAEVYEAMYATFIDYREEYEFYSSIIRKYNKKSVLEIGCGTGNLTKHFDENGFEYYGLDLNQEMLDIARKKNPEGIYIQGDMRSFELAQALESAIITARTISYLISNEDVNATFKNIHNNLKKDGILSFDFIDANRFILEMRGGKEVEHSASHNRVDYVRKSKWTPNLKNGMDCTWASVYYKREGQQLVEIGKNHALVRTFTCNEIELFLQINDFEVKDIIERPSYAFPTYVVIAQKKET